MKYQIITITAAILKTLTVDKGNPRPDEFRPHKDLFVNIADNGWKPKEIGLGDAKTFDHPVLFLRDGVDLKAALAKPSKGDLTIGRGGHRMGTLLMAVSDALPKGFAAEAKGKVASIVDHGDVQALVVIGADNAERAMIATDDDPLRRKWSVLHRYQQYRRLVSCGMSKDDAYKAVGYTARNQIFDTIANLPSEVQAAWINGQLGTEDNNGKRAIRITNTQLNELNALHKDTNKGRGTVLVGDAKTKFEAILSGREDVRPSLMTDKSLDGLAKRFGQSPMGLLVQTIRGLDQQGNVISDTVRGNVLNTLVTEHGIQLPTPDDASEPVGDAKPVTEPVTGKRSKRSKQTA